MEVSNGASMVINFRNSCEEDGVGGEEICYWCLSYVG